MLGYFDDQMANEQSLNASGWSMTGDLGSLDQNGCLVRRAQEGHHPAWRPQHLPCAYRGARAASSRHSQGCSVSCRGCAARLACMPRDGDGAAVARCGPTRCWITSTQSACRTTTCRNHMLFLDELPLTAGGKITNASW